MMLQKSIGYCCRQRGIPKSLHHYPSFIDFVLIQRAIVLFLCSILQLRRSYMIFEPAVCFLVYRRML